MTALGRQDDASPIVRWDRRPGGARVAMLGVVMVGQVQPYPAAGYEANWFVTLPGCDDRLRRARTVEDAVSGVERAVLAWIDAAGLAAAAVSEQPLRTFRRAEARS